ncbi:AAA family ATPase [Candidatus Daviesbacteria bacterium]|nr:AAA family ATPase [Candidatus Daviesbacteria bacterium]
MKLLTLPYKLFIFWYPDALAVFIRSWRNSVLYLEEDLAVELMAKLLFTPLFHDSTIAGRLLSFVFRLSRILIGLFALALATIAIFALAIFWFLTPFLAILGLLQIIHVAFIWLSALIFFSGIVLFTHHIFSHPRLKIWQIKDAQNIWAATFVKKGEINLTNLLKNEAVINFLTYLEKTSADFTQMISLDQNLDEAALLQEVLKIGRDLKIPNVGTEHFFVARISKIYDIENQLAKIDLKLTDFYDALDFLRRKRVHWRTFFIWDEDFHIKHLRGVNRGWLGSPTPTLDSVGEDLTKKAAKEWMEDFIGRPNVVSQVLNILSLEGSRNVVIVGEPGVGKNTLVNYLAKLIVQGDAPAPVMIKRLVQIDLTKLISGVTAQGDLAQKIKTIFEEVDFSGNVILFVDQIENMGLGETGSQFNLYSLMLPYLDSSKFQFIAATDPLNYTKVLEKNAAFARLFTKVELPPASEAETVDILKMRAIESERFRKINFSILAIKEIADLCARFIHDRLLPDSAISTFAATQVAAQNGWVKKSQVEQVVHQQSNIPIGAQGKENQQMLLNLENVIHQKLIDQEQAVKAIADTLRRSAAKLREQNRPVGSFLFVGPTGVGKTETAKILADVYFHGRGKFLRFDMSEYQTAEAVDKLIGSNGDEGMLTAEVRNNPYSLILLDEFEKADPKILTLFLQVLDDGRLTSGAGRLIDFTNTIIITTSNAASVTIAKGLESGQMIEQLDKAVNDELLTIFKPELLNRFDDVILFKPLSKEDLQKIVQIKLEDLRKNLKDQGYPVEFDQELISELAQAGYDPVLGARPLRRLIQDTIEARLSIMMLENKLQKGEQFHAGVNLLN